tara:strand:+ start:11590 stop:12210 length:621 start_codon:yes stop_codon:yes gene_type:complete
MNQNQSVELPTAEAIYQDNNHIPLGHIVIEFFPQNDSSGNSINDSSGNRLIQIPFMETGIVETFRQERSQPGDIITAYKIFKLRETLALLNIGNCILSLIWIAFFPILSITTFFVHGSSIITIIYLMNPSHNTTIYIVKLLYKIHFFLSICKLCAGILYMFITNIGYILILILGVLFCDNITINNFHLLKKELEYYTSAHFSPGII